MSTTSLSCITRETAQKDVDLCIIWLHGLGADNTDFLDIIPALQLPPSINIRFVFPNAPLRAITINGGAHCRAWYDIYDLNRLSREDHDGVAASHAEINALIQQQLLLGLNSQQIILAGFSQGGAIALYAGLQYPQPLAGILALSCYLPCQNHVLESLATCQRATPILQMHGEHDDIVPYALGQQTHATLQTTHQIKMKSYAMSHQVIPQQLNDISQWLQQRLPQHNA